MRRVTVSVTALANAGSVAMTNVGTPDDNNLRTLAAVWCTPITAAGAVLTIYRAGQQLEQIDLTRFAAGNLSAEIFEQFPPTLNFQYSLVNNSGGAITVALIFTYDVGASQGSRAAPPVGSI